MPIPTVPNTDQKFRSPRWKQALFLISLATVAGIALRAAEGETATSSPSPAGSRLAQVHRYGRGDHHESLARFALQYSVTPPPPWSSLAGEVGTEDRELPSLNGNEPATDPTTAWIGDRERNRRVLYTTAAGIGAVTIWGLAKWDYFSAPLKGKDEGWFGNSTKHGGADKLGHLFTTYASSHLLAKLYRHWRFEPDEAALYGAITSWAVMGYMELGDAFSEYGFSYEDMIANTVGCAVGYAMYRYPSLAEKLDFRWEYGFQPESSDLITDYENSKFLFALKLNGFEPLRQTWLRHLELHLGYYTRGFDDNEPDRERNLYGGIGLNLTDLLFRRGYRKTGRFLRYMQIPYTYYEKADDLN